VLELDLVDEVEGLPMMQTRLRLVAILMKGLVEDAATRMIFARRQRLQLIFAEDSMARGL
jgi:hypothetical protein